MSWYGGMAQEGEWRRGWVQDSRYDSYSNYRNSQDWDNEGYDAKSWDDHSDSENWDCKGYYHKGTSDWAKWGNRVQDKSKGSSKDPAGEGDEEDLSANATFLGSTSISPGHKKGVLRLEKQGLASCS